MGANFKIQKIYFAPSQAFFFLSNNCIFLNIKWLFDAGPFWRSSIADQQHRSLSVIKKKREKSRPIQSFPPFLFPSSRIFLLFLYFPLCSRKLFLSSFLLRLYSYFLSCVSTSSLEERRNKKERYSSIITTLACLGLLPSSSSGNPKMAGAYILSRVSVV